MNALKELEVLKELEEHCRVTKDKFGQEGAYILEFNYGRAITTIRIILSGTACKDLLITNMTTLPESSQRARFGGRSLQALILWAHRNDMQYISAVQVQTPSENFWKKNSFISLDNETNDFVYEKK